MYKELLPDRVDVLGPRHPDTLRTRYQIAGYTGATGHPDQALRLLQELLPEVIDILGSDHSLVGNVTSAISWWREQGAD